MTDEQARQMLARQERDMPGPYLFLGFGKLDEQPVMTKAESLDAPAHETLEGAYREFRRKGRVQQFFRRTDLQSVLFSDGLQIRPTKLFLDNSKVPQGRFAIWVGCDLHPKTFRPQEFIALDSQLCDKAFATPTTPG